MIDIRKTLENLHQILPELGLEDLFRVLDAIEEIPQINVPYISSREYISTREPDSGNLTTKFTHL